MRLNISPPAPASEAYRELFGSIVQVWLAPPLLTLVECAQTPPKSTGLVSLHCDHFPHGARMEGWMLLFLVRPDGIEIDRFYERGWQEKEFSLDWRVVG